MHFNTLNLPKLLLVFLKLAQNTHKWAKPSSTKPALHRSMDQLLQLTAHSANSETQDAVRAPECSLRVFARLTGAAAAAAAPNLKEGIHFPSLVQKGQTQSWKYFLLNVYHFRTTRSQGLTGRKCGADYTLIRKPSALEWMGHCQVPMGMPPKT